MAGFSGLEGPNREQIQEDEDDKLRQHRLDRARRILGAYYLLLPFVLVYVLFKIFPPNPWGDVQYVPIAIGFAKFTIWTTLEERLILLVIAAGALGSYIHSATSYADYRGNRQFGPSWLLWYMLRPLVGVCLALIVYFAMRGGLLSMVINGETAKKPDNINPFGIAAISGLTGMFSKQASDKLAEVFTTLFKSQGDQLRRDSLATAPAPTMKKVDPEKGPEAGGTPITITGTGFVKEAKVFFADKQALRVVVASDTTITADTPEGKGVVDVAVINPDEQKVILAKGYTYTPAATGDAAATEAAEGSVVAEASTAAASEVDAGLSIPPANSGPSSPPGAGKELDDSAISSPPTGADAPDPMDEPDDADVSSPPA